MQTYSKPSFVMIGAFLGADIWVKSSKYENEKNKFQLWDKHIPKLQRVHVNYTLNIHHRCLLHVSKKEEASRSLFRHVTTP